ncbi:SDR family NAD(P)-dependent oxidoreductase [Paracoccus sp. R12_1]|uniref:SDR family oxidoreductase n=1 Tax=unclassified Paracoccus (in: a-proteobacteria) TaxID=2688777 RepID=UPI001ADAB5F4|nr:MULTISPECIES: SDR family NAD(P)-dependent oxidoreductase [unclassified Paracoccus (in: a-proteobacteria)]MBO9454336.1 SDR family NAD(P)-dependent oxidoreductase [Paracoccus sp. R12_2]MBO9485122.1 SDR family NAD(P)-dependent oxidoreductase [Paracoccus sp. R12_1]
MPKTLFITGASSGIGAATAHAAVASGWNVALMARSEDKLRSLQNELGDAAAIFPGDVTQEADLLRATSGAVDRFGGIDAVFANAGRGLSKPGTEGGDLDDIRGMIDLNITGLVMTARATLPELRKTQGTLVLTGSAAGRRHIAGSIYGATKWFVHGYAGNMAEEMREWGGRCAVVAPGMVDTPFFDQGAPDKLQPEDVANAVIQIIDAPKRAAIREIFLMPQA